MTEECVNNKTDIMDWDDYYEPEERFVCPQCGGQEWLSKCCDYDRPDNNDPIDVHTEDELDMALATGRIVIETEHCDLCDGTGSVDKYTYRGYLKYESE